MIRLAQTCAGSFSFNLSSASTFTNTSFLTIHEADLKTRPTAFGRYAYQRIIAGGLVSASDYINALRLRAELTALVKWQGFTPWMAWRCRRMAECCMQYTAMELAIKEL